MLVLSRHRDEAIVIGDDIRIVIVDIRGDKVRLGVDAPSNIPVHREEVYDAIKRQRREDDIADAAAALNATPASPTQEQPQSSSPIITNAPPTH